MQTYRSDDAVRSVVAIENVSSAIDQIAQTTLRAVVGRHTLDETLGETDRHDQPEHPRDPRRADRGVRVVKITTVKVGIQLPESMQRAKTRRDAAVTPRLGGA